MWCEEDEVTATVVILTTTDTLLTGFDQKTGRLKGEIIRERERERRSSSPLSWVTLAGAVWLASPPSGTAPLVVGWGRVPWQWWALVPVPLEEGGEGLLSLAPPSRSMIVSRPLQYPLHPGAGSHPPVPEAMWGAESEEESRQPEIK